MVLCKFFCSTFWIFNVFVTRIFGWFLFRSWVHTVRSQNQYLKKNHVRRLGDHPLVSVHWPSCVQNWLQHVTPASKNIFKISRRAEVVMVDPHIHSFSRLLAISNQASPSRRRSSQAPPFSLSKVYRKQNLCKAWRLGGWAIFGLEVSLLGKVQGPHFGSPLFSDETLGNEWLLL